MSFLARDVTVTCTACHFSFTVERTSAGMACNCPECGELLDVPAAPKGVAWVAVLMLGGLLVAGGIVWSMFFAPAANDAPANVKKPLAKGKLDPTTPVLPEIDSIPFVSESKTIPGRLPEVVDSTPPADPFVTPSLDTLVAQATGKTPEEKGNTEKIEPATKAAPSSSGILLEEAFQAYRRNEPAKAIEILKDAKIRFPDLPPLGFMVGELHLTHNNVVGGRAELERVAIEDPKYPGTYLMFGNLAIAEGRSTDAQLLFEKAESLQGEIKDADRKRILLTSIRAGQTSVAEARKDWPGVIKAATEWLAIDPKSGRARQRLARAFLAKGQAKEAAAELETAYQQDKTLALPDITLATYYTELGDFKGAEECLLRVAKANPKDARVQQAVASWMLNQDRAQEAQTYINESLKIDPTSSDARYIAGLVARHLHDFKTAESSFEAVLRDSPANFQASNQLTLSLADQEEETKRRRAVEMAEVNARQYPRNADASATLGWVYYRTGKLEQAEQALQSAISGGRATSDMAYYLAHVMADRGRIDDAARLLQGALRAPGTFMFRKEAQAWLDRITSKPKR